MGPVDYRTGLLCIRGVVMNVGVHIHGILDDLGEFVSAMCTGNWSRDRSGAPCIDWFLTLSCGDTYKTPLPVFVDWFPDLVPACTIGWGKTFMLPDDDDRTVYTMDRGNGMYPWVSWVEDGERRTSGCYVGEKVIPL